LGIPDIDFVEYRPEYGLEIVKMWRQSFQRAMNLEEHNHIGEVSGQLDFFCAIDPACIRVLMDKSSSTVAGFMALTPGSLDHLYINVEYQGRGLGSKLLNEAKSQSPQGLELYTFQKNERAQKFYEARGFSVIELGFAEAATNPWAASQDELADIKYKWFG